MQIYIVSTMFNGNAMARQLLARGVKIAGMIGLAESVPREDIYGYESPKSWCDAQGIPFIPMRSYTMRNPEDCALLSSHTIDVALILGWQRLVPEWFLQQCRIGAIGVHGSSDGIAGGRGRSPQNWALMLGKEAFHLSIFFADPGVDSGPVIDSCAIPLTVHDDIYSSHLKIGRATVEMLVRNFENGAIQARRAAPQKGEVRYLPQRKPEDGEIDWHRSSHEVYNFVRALTRPYPGAFCKVEGAELRIWRARPFVEPFASPHQPGTILANYSNTSFLVASQDGALLVDDFECTIALHEGMVLTSRSYDEHLAFIGQRHRSRYPDMKLIAELEKYA